MTADQIRAQQRLLPLPVASNVALVTLDHARAILGVDSESVSSLIDDGTLRWVWDFAISTRATSRRELRFWKIDLLAAHARLKEQAEPIATRDLLLPTVVDSILTPSKSAFHAAELQALFTCSAQLIQSYAKGGHMTGQIRNHTRWVTRSSLVAFLTQRLIEQ
jgi:hypothetical protein